MILFYLYLLGIPLMGGYCAWKLSEQMVIEANDVVGALVASIFWLPALLGLGIWKTAKLFRELRRWNERRKQKDS